MKAARAYRLRRGEPLREEVRRVAYGRIDHALDGLRGASPETREDAVHEARKDMKKLRALLRLVRGDIGKQRARRENACFRDAARELAGARDADVMLATLDGLELPDAVDWDVRKALAAHRQAAAAQRQAAAARAGTAAFGSAVATLEGARSRVARWELEDDSFETLRKGLKRSYRAGRRGLKAARRTPTAEALHEWRKRAKDVRYHQALLGLDALAEESRVLTDLLGEHNDLAVLSDWVAGHTSLGPVIAETARPRRQELLAEALACGEGLYAAKPGPYARASKRAWEGLPTAGEARIRVP